jgi:hypothetical protein
MRCPLGANRLLTWGLGADFGTVGGPAGGCRCREQQCGRASSPTGCRFLAAEQNRLDIGAADATDFVPVVEASPTTLLRQSCSLAAFAVPLFLVAGVGRAANVNFNFNASPEGWTFGSGSVGQWQGIPTAAWRVTNHVAPAAPALASLAAAMEADVG